MLWSTCHGGVTVSWSTFHGDVAVSIPVMEVLLYAMFYLSWRYYCMR